MGLVTKTRTVDRLSCVRFASARNPVPTRLIGLKVHLVLMGRWLSPSLPFAAHLDGRPAPGRRHDRPPVLLSCHRLRTGAEGEGGCGD
jgi:hypothetical protein